MTVSNKRIVLRDLPGIAQLEARLRRIQQHPTPSRAAEAQGLEEAADRISRQLFGITAAETQFNEEHDWPGHLSYAAALAGWEAHFELPDTVEGDPAVQERLLWSLLGWDIADEQGRPLLSLAYFDRQMICVVSGLCGRAPDRSEVRVIAQERVAALA